MRAADMVLICFSILFYFQEAVTSLNALLYELSPRDPAPPRRSKRNAEDEEAEVETKRKKKRKLSPSGALALGNPSSEMLVATTPTESWSASADAGTTEPVSPPHVPNIKQKTRNDDAPGSPSKFKQSKSRQPSTKKPTRDVARDVGGWVSPMFANEVDRTWLEKTHAPPKFDLYNPPQVGQVILYYPSAHLEFLKQHPDFLSSRLKDSSRTPLWNRATKDGQRKKVVLATKEPAHSAAKAAWWNQEWLQGFHHSNFGDYPIVCRVERTHAEFPKDPFANQKNVVKSNENGDAAVRLEWGLPASAKSGDNDSSSNKKVSASKSKRKVRMRLAVLLRPLTPLLPPVFEGNGTSIVEELAVPPLFSVITFPSRAEPFLIPFSWGYRAYHSLSVGDIVETRVLSQRVRKKDADEEDESRRGRVLSFETIGGNTTFPKNMAEAGDDFSKNAVANRFGSFRLEDRMSLLHGILDQLQNATLSGVSKRQAVENLLSQDDSSAASKHQPKTGASTASIPFSEICRVIDFWTQFRDQHQQPVASLSSCTAITPIGIVDLIRMTLPIRNGVGINKVTNQRKKECFSRWSLDTVTGPLTTVAQKQSNRPISLLPYHSPWVVPGVSEGYPDKLDSALLAKLKCTIEDFIQNNENAVIFVPPVSDDIAPGYSCAVPIGMCFEKILTRLKLTKTASSEPRSYYSTVGSVLGDLQQIVDNCVLYNDPESQVAKIALELIPAAKRLITDVANRHAREATARTKAADERRRFVLQSCASMTLEDQPTETEDMKNGNRSNPKKASASKSRNSLSTTQFFAPFKRPLYRGWLQRLQPDDSWKALFRNNAICNKVSNLNMADGAAPSNEQGELTTWIPQCSDKVLYSRFLHSEFVKGHYLTLTDDQCQLPLFRLLDEDSNYTAEQDTSNIPDTPENLIDAVQTHWLVGTVAWVRSDFPRKAGTSTFETEAPVLLVGIQFDYEWDKGETHTVVWRPCLFSQLQEESKLKSEMPPYCGSCGVPIASSFLRPAWIRGNLGMDKILHQSHTTLHDPAQPNGLLDDVAGSICRCLDVLKRRCLLRDTPVDHVDSQRYLDGSLPVITRVQGLPSYVETLQNAAQNCDSTILIPKVKPKSINTRGIRKPKGEDRSALEKLAKCHFLPPWFSPQLVINPSLRKSKALYRHETLLPFPNACIEIIRVRVQNGYYRSESAIRSDLLEAYVSSVLFILSEPATRKNDPLSVRKLARYLSSPKGNTNTNSLISNIRGSISTKKIAKNAQSKKVAKQKKRPEEGKQSQPLLSGDKPIPRSTNATTSSIRSPVSNKKISKEAANAAKKAAEITMRAKQEKSKKVRGDKNDTKKAVMGKKPIKNIPQDKKTVTSGKQKKAVKNEEEKGITKNIQARKRTPDPDSLFAKEKGLIDRIDAIRRLYAMVIEFLSYSCWFLRIVCLTFLFHFQALVCVSDTHSMERLFGLKSTQNDPQRLDVSSLVPSPAEISRTAAITRVRVVLDAIRKDPRHNRFPLYAPRKLKISCGGEAVTGERPAIVLEDGRILTPTANHVSFRWDYCQRNERLAQALFGCPGRSFPCARCQVHGVSFFTCRVRNGHSNPDFNLLLNFGGVGVGGVRGLLAPLISDPSSETASTAGASQGYSEPVNALVAAGEGHNSGENHRPMGLQNHTDSKVPATTEIEENGAEPKKKAFETKSSARLEAPSRQLADSTLSTNHTTRDDQNHPTTKLETEDHDEDPRELLKKARAALALASKIHREAEKLSNSTVRLSEYFIKTTFPFDPTDNHYMYCIICGLSGDLLCCDGCSNVVHPSCVGISDIPEDDWYCEKCVEKKASASSTEVKANVSKMIRQDEASKFVGTSDRGIQPNERVVSELPLSETAVAADASSHEISSFPNTETSLSHYDGQAESSEQQSPESKSTGDKQGWIKELDWTPEGPIDELDDEIEGQLSKLDKVLRGLEPKTKSVVEDEEDNQEANDATEHVVDNDVLPTKLEANNTMNTTSCDQGSRQGLPNEQARCNGGNGKDVASLPKVNDTKKVIPVGTELLKAFGELGDFKGQVVSIPNGDNPFYVVKYEDGDEEEMSETELENYVVRKASPNQTKKRKATNKPKADQENLPRKRRGRPPKSKKNESAPKARAFPSTEKKDEEKTSKKHPQSELKKLATSPGKRRSSDVTTSEDPPTFDVLAEVAKLADDN